VYPSIVVSSLAIKARKIEENEDLSPKKKNGIRLFRGRRFQRNMN